MDFKVAEKYIVDHYGMVVDTEGRKILANTVIFCRIKYFIITEEGDIDCFPRGKTEFVYEADQAFFYFLKEQVRELQEEKTQSVITCVFKVLTGTKQKTQGRQVTGILPTTVMPGIYSPTTVAETLATTPDVLPTTAELVPVATPEVIPAATPVITPVEGQTVVTVVTSKVITLTIP